MNQHDLALFEAVKELAAKACEREAEGSYGMQQWSPASEREGYGREVRSAKMCAATIRSLTPDLLPEIAGEADDLLRIAVDGLREICDGHNESGFQLSEIAYRVLDRITSTSAMSTRGSGS